MRLYDMGVGALARKLWEISCPAAGQDILRNSGEDFGFMAVIVLNGAQH
jgi:hypothetical protein